MILNFVTPKPRFSIHILFSILLFQSSTHIHANSNFQLPFEKTPQDCDQRLLRLSYLERFIHEMDKRGYPYEKIDLLQRNVAAVKVLPSAEWELGRLSRFLDTLNTDLIYAPKILSGFGVKGVFSGLREREKSHPETTDRNVVLLSHEGAQDLKITHIEIHELQHAVGAAFREAGKDSPFHGSCRGIHSAVRDEGPLEELNCGAKQVGFLIAELNKYLGSLRNMDPDQKVANIPKVLSNQLSTLIGSISLVLDERNEQATAKPDAEATLRASEQLGRQLKNKEWRVQSRSQSQITLVPVEKSPETILITLKNPPEKRLTPNLDTWIAIEFFTDPLSQTADMRLGYYQSEFVDRMRPEFFPNSPSSETDLIRDVFRLLHFRADFLRAVSRTQLKAVSLLSDVTDEYFGFKSTHDLEERYFEADQKMTLSEVIDLLESIRRPMEIFSSTYLSVFSVLGTFNFKQGEIEEVHHE